MPIYLIDYIWFNFDQLCSTSHHFIGLFFFCSRSLHKFSPPPPDYLACTFTIIFKYFVFALFLIDIILLFALFLVSLVILQSLSQYSFILFQETFWITIQARRCKVAQTIVGFAYENDAMHQTIQIRVSKTSYRCKRCHKFVQFASKYE